MGGARESLVSTVYRKIGGFVYGKYNGMFRACASSVYQASRGGGGLVGHLSNVNNIFVGNKKPPRELSGDNNTISCYL